MGQGGSQELPPSLSSVLLPRRVEFFMDLEPFPDDILFLIFSFVPARELVLRCRGTSRRWKSLVDSPSLWRIKCERERRRDVLLAAEMCSRMSWQRVAVMTPFSRNLLRNPCATEEFNHWSIRNGGDGWAVEDNRSLVEGAENQTCFVTSFSWCEKSQIIDLLQEGLWPHFLDIHQPVICISDWFGGRQDCGCIYQITVKLLAADKKTVLQTFTRAPDPIPQWNDAKYQQVSHEFRYYGPGVRYVNFSHRGKDTQFWKGRYGARITNSSVIVKCDNLKPCRSDPNTGAG